MKAIYVSKTPFNRLTVGKTYETLQGVDGRWAVIDDDGYMAYWISKEQFRPIPEPFNVRPIPEPFNVRPIPEPVNEWMKIDGDSFINMKTGMRLEFNNKSHNVRIESIYSEYFYFAQHEYAEAFAQMVGYKWVG